jgi:hypothetical protein
METSFQGMFAPPWGATLAWFKSVHHVSEHVSMMSPVFTEGRLAPALLSSALTQQATTFTCCQFGVILKS